MNKTLKISLWGVAIFLLLIIIGGAIYLISFLKATKAMTPAETGIINDTVWCIKDKFVNSYIFKGEQSYLMIDAGIGVKNFKREMDKIGINPDKITKIFLTHTDGDHIGAIGLFKNAVIYMHNNEEQMINGTNGKTKYSKPIWKFGRYTLLDSNDSLVIDGLKIKILYTPGHTPGSSCYLVGNDYLLTGDNLTLSNDKYDHFVEKFNMNTPQQMESLKLLPDPGSFKYVLTAHHGAIKTGDQ
jgi:glyoxylase-like metal-dependent hydrolase (beta-lactamase superfamily II)